MTNLINRGPLWNSPLPTLLLTVLRQGPRLKAMQLSARRLRPEFTTEAPLVWPVRQRGMLQ